MAAWPLPSPAARAFLGEQQPTGPRMENWMKHTQHFALFSASHRVSSFSLEGPT